MTKYFTYRPSKPGDYSKCIIIPANYDTFPMNTKNGGSYNVAPARVLGLSYGTYIRWITNKFPLEITVSYDNHTYPVVYWKAGGALEYMIKLLNNKLTLALREGMNNDKLS